MAEPNDPRAEARNQLISKAVSKGINPADLAFLTRPQKQVDPRLAFLLYSAIRFDLVEAGHLDVEEAFEDVVVTLEGMEALSCFLCVECQVRAAEADHAIPEKKKVAAAKPRPTPPSVIEAIMYSVRTRGVAALKEPATVERLSRCDPDARDQIKQRIAALKRAEA